MKKFLASSIMIMMLLFAPTSASATEADSGSPVLTPLMSQLKCPEGYKLNIPFDPNSKVSDDSAVILDFYEASEVQLAYSVVNDQPRLDYAQGCEATSSKRHAKSQNTLIACLAASLAANVLMAAIIFGLARNKTDRSNPS